jgi:FkbM family methyltransferase
MPRTLYSRFGLRRGLGRLLMTLAAVHKPLQSLPVRVKDGRVLYMDLRELMCIPYVLTGEIPGEQGETEFLRSIVRPGETVLDIGGNVGWYSTLLSEAVGPHGQVYAFEPNERALRLLRSYGQVYPQLRVVPAALGDEEGQGSLNLPPEGAACSLRGVSGARATQACRITTLDSFLFSEGIRGVSFIKCDVEGMEMEVLRGARGVLQSAQPPMWLMEINEPARFGNPPEHVPELFRQFGYDAYWVDSRSGRLRPVPSPITFKIDVIFVPGWLRDRVEAYGSPGSPVALEAGA